MAMPQPLLPLLMVLSISFVFATRSSVAAAAGDDSLKTACSETTFSGICVETLKSIPEIQTASPRQVALAALKYLVKEGETLVVESQREVAGSKDVAIKPCLTVLDTKLKSDVEPLSKLTPELSDAKFGEATDVVTGMLSAVSNDAQICMGDAVSKNPNPIITKIFKYEEMLQVTGDLMENAQAASLPHP
ncbi:hypothetical protein QOZ80_3BG0268240 [Eleusine coracana subsp. coracana]|nr:hypothetical protein QOZ80_3BG0268240 [Eleusine coracana subsp. coracana]